MPGDDGGRGPQGGEVWRALERIEKSFSEKHKEATDERRQLARAIEDVKREIGARIDGHERRHISDYRDARGRYDALRREMAGHFTEDAELFAELRTGMQTRTWLGGLGLLVSTALAAFGVRTPTP